MKTIEIKCEGAMTLLLENMTPIQGNLKTLSNKNYEKLKKQILRLGYSEPISIWDDEGKFNIEGKFHIINGHQRYRTLKAMQEDGYEIPPLPINLVEASSLKEAKEKVLSLTAQYGEITDEGLYEFMAESDLKMPDLEDLRFPEIDLKKFEQNFFTEPVVVNEGDDEVPDIDENKHKVELGDIWLLGDHRLMCGDSTDRAVVDRLLVGEKVDMVFTDPPYGVNELTDRVEHVKTFKKQGIAKKGKYQPIAGDDSIETAMSVWNIVNDICNTIVFWGGNYFPLTPSPCWIVWDKRVEEKQTDLNSDCELAYVKHPHKKSVRIFRHLWKGMIKASEKNESRVHPTQKPIALAVWCFENYGDPKSVLDLFLGSGSTLIACEKTGRKCFGMEIDPHYCSVIIERWQNLTGKRAVKVLPNGLRELANGD